MNRYKFKDGRQLRCGYTTGTCAAAAAKGAAAFLLKGVQEPSVFLYLPEGEEIEIPTEFCERESEGRKERKRAAGHTESADDMWKNQEIYVCGVRKDAGDDADITDGILICARVCLTADRADRGTSGSGGDGCEKGIFIDGGEGVGRVTRPGLDQPVGAAAINTVPRRMIAEAVKQVCEETGYEGEISVEIFVPEGREAAEKTFNPVLGIEGGISILGTSGVVEPMSDSAIVETIRAEIRVKAEAEMHKQVTTEKSGREGLEGFSKSGKSVPEKSVKSTKFENIGKPANFPVCLTAVPGNYGMKFACEQLKLSEDRIVKCSNFIGETLDICWEYGLSGILLAGNAGKLIKLTSGVMNTHSSYADARIETVLACALKAGASLRLLHEIAECVTTEAAFSLLKDAGLGQLTLDIAAERAAVHAARRVRSQLKTGVILFSSESGLVSYGGAAKELLEEMRISDS